MIPKPAFATPVPGPGIPTPGGGLEGITNPALSARLQSMTGGQFLGSLISSLIGLALIIAALVFFFMLLIGGIQWMTSGGDPKAVESARGRITNAIIGLTIVFSVWAIMMILEAFLGITIVSGVINLPIIGPKP